MPDLPQHFPLTKLTASDLASVERWGSSLTQQLIREWTLLVQTVNALSRVDLAANRPATPGLDHIFFTESDGSQTTYVAVNGAWRALTSGGAGSPGATGPAVFLEVEGLDGEPGPPGSAGLAGTAGTTGSQGPLGPAVFLEADIVEGEPGPPGPQGAVGPIGLQGQAGPAVFLDADAGDEGAIGPPGPKGNAGASATWTIVETNLGAAGSESWRGRFTLTDASIIPSSKVAIQQAPGPYTGKGTRADEAEMDPLWCMAESGSGQATVYWRALAGIVSTIPDNRTDVLASGGFNYPPLQEHVAGRVRGNVKFQYQVGA